MGQTILFVDDDAGWRTMISTCLTDAGFDVVTAADATQAMARVEESVPALIVLDLNLDGESGLMLMQFVTRNNPDVPIILYTGREDDAEAIMAMLQQGAHSYVRKGRPEDLIEAIRLALP